MLNSKNNISESAEKSYKYSKRTFVVLLFLVSFAYAGSLTLPPIELTFKPSVETKTDSQIRLLPKDTELIEGDAVLLYQKAIKSLPKDFNSQQFLEWRKLPNDLDQLPVEEIETELKILKPIIDLLNQAAKCKQCNWPKVTLKQAQQQLATDDLSKYRELGFILDVQVKIQIVQGQYNKAIETIKTSLTMSNHMGQAPTLVQGTVAIAMASINLQRIEQLIQTDNAPNIYDALRKLPHPFVDVEKEIKYETDNFKDPSIIRRILLRGQTQKILKPAHDNVRKLANHIERRITALQIIEVLRIYAGKHDGKLPVSLSDITEAEIPKDPVTKKPFEYKSTGSEATIQIEGTEGSDGRDSVRIEIKMKK